MQIVGKPRSLDNALVAHITLSHAHASLQGAYIFSWRIHLLMAHSYPFMAFFHMRTYRPLIVSCQHKQKR